MNSHELKDTNFTLMVSKVNCDKDILVFNVVLRCSFTKETLHLSPSTSAAQRSGPFLHIHMYESHIVGLLVTKL